MRVDSHQHFWRYNPVRDAWIGPDMGAIRRDFLPADLAPILKTESIDATVAVQADQSESETSFLLDLAAHNPFIAGVVGWVDLRSPDLPSRLKHFAQYPKLRGFRHVAQSEPDDNFLLGSDFTRGIARLHEFHFTYDILVYARQLPSAIGLVQKFPEQAFVLDHIAKPAIKAQEIDAWARNMRALASHPNVYCKVSGMVTEADLHNWKPADFHPYLDVAYETFGPDRLMFGSDWPVCLLAASYRQVKQLVTDYLASKPAADRDKIFGANAARFYSLKVNR